jgi:hypothetical protein
MTFVLLLVCPAIVFFSLMAFAPKQPTIQKIIWVAFFLRIVAQFAVQNFAFFSHAARGDSQLYQWNAELVAQMWRHGSVHFVTKHELPAIGQAALPVNAYAVVAFLNGETSVFASTMIVVTLGSLTGLVLYNLAKDLGCSQKHAAWCSAAFTFSPAFVYYTADMYKDGFVVFLTIATVSNAIRLSWKFSVARFAVAIVGAVGLWYVRPYLVFATLIPLVVGLVGFDRSSPLRKIFLGLGALTAVLIVTSTSQVLGDASEAANDYFKLGTSNIVRNSNGHAGGSAVMFDDGGSAYGALPIKLVYTLFAPFPWMGGSFGLHIGKVDALVTLFFFYRSLVAIRKHWKTNKGTLLALLSFIVPMTIVYALGMANIGLILRQRMPISAAIIVLGFMSWVPVRGQASEPVINRAQKPTRARRGAAA